VSIIDRQKIREQNNTDFAHVCAAILRLQHELEKMGIKLEAIAVDRAVPLIAAGEAGMIHRLPSGIPEMRIQGCKIEERRDSAEMKRARL
jgi:hypothetical protein